MQATDPNCIFCKIVRGEIPGKKVYEDADVLAFHDIQPVAPVHFMLIPKKHVASMYDLTADDAPVMGKIMTLAGRLAREQGAGDGFRTIVNTGPRRATGSPACPRPRDRRPGAVGTDDPAEQES